MKLEKIINRIESLEKRENDLVSETEQQIESLKQQLGIVKEKLEDTFMTGDIAQGEKLSIEKGSLEAKIGYLETFMEKRKSLPIIAKPEAAEIKSDLKEEMFKAFAADKKKFDVLMKDISLIISNGDDVMNKVRESGQTVNRMTKEYDLFLIDGRITGFYSHLKRFANGYDATKPNIESLFKEE